MNHPPAPKPKPMFHAGPVEGKDGQFYADIPANIMAKFKQARMSPASNPITPTSSAASTAAAARVESAAADSSPSSSSQPPAWVKAEAKKLQEEAVHANGHVQQTTSAPAQVTKAPPVADTYDAYKAEYEASLQRRKTGTNNSAPAATSGAATTTMTESKEQTASEIAHLQQQIALQTQERNQQVSGLMDAMNQLTGLH